jgi:hypothetical protein
VRRGEGGRRHVRGRDDGHPVAPDREDRQEGPRERRLLVRARALPVQRELRRLRARDPRHAEESRMDLRAHAGTEDRRDRERLHVGDGTQARRLQQPARVFEDHAGHERRVQAERRQAPGRG